MKDFVRIKKFFERILNDCKYLYFDLKKQDVRVWDKGSGERVTDIDIRINRYIFEECRLEFPEIGWFSEETKDSKKRLGKRFNFIVDPIDGTKQLISGKPEFVFSIALEEFGKIKVAAILNPETDEYYEAVRGEGAYKNGKKIRVMDSPETNGHTIYVSTTEFEKGILNREKFSNLTPLGSTAYKVVKVAEGKGIATVIKSPRMEWDVAACSLILEEAGGKITDFTGKNLTFNQYVPVVQGIIATNSQVHDEISKNLKEFYKN